MIQIKLCTFAQIKGKKKEMAADLQQLKLRFGIIGMDAELHRALDIAVQVAPTDLTVLITGESGVGKENFPRIIHQISPRKHGPYVAVNCGAIPEGTIDSELFGHEKGAFTGAIGERKGYFGEADKGTIFLDEVGELPLATQARLLRVLESGEFMKVGSSRVEKTNVRVVAATNIRLMEAIRKGRFREDLFYRLSTVPIQIPPLRKRGTDIVLLLRKFAADFAEKYHMPPIVLTDDAKELLMQYPWPGNVRQLKNVTEQISIIERQREISATLLERYLTPIPNTTMGVPALMGQDHPGNFETERELLYKVLFDLRREVNELKETVQKLANKEKDTSATPVQQNHALIHESHALALAPQHKHMLIEQSASSHEKPHFLNGDVQDAAEIIEDPLSLNDVEHDMIEKALERHHGKRKQAAQDLHISERTLYRKIKAYGLDK